MKVHNGIYWEGNHDGDGFYLPACGQVEFTYETKNTDKHQDHVAPESDTFRVTCLKCLSKLKLKGNKK